MRNIVSLVLLFLTGMIYANEWDYAGTGLRYILIQYKGGEVLILEISPEHFYVDINYARKRHYIDKSWDINTMFAINGPYFYTNDENQGIPVGLIKTRTGKYGSFNSKYPFFYVTGDSAGIARSYSWILPRLESDIILFQTGPVLVWNSKQNKNLGNKLSERSAIGITTEGNIMFCITKNAYISLVELSALMKQYGCIKALNLDGGGSSQAIFRYGDFEWISRGYYKIPSYISIRQK